MQHETTRMIDDAALRLLEMLWTYGPSSTDRIKRLTTAEESSELIAKLPRLVEAGLVERAKEKASEIYGCKLSKHQARSVLLEELLHRTIQGADVARLVQHLAH